MLLASLRLAIFFFPVTEKSEVHELPEGWPCNVQGHATCAQMNIELAVSKLAFKKNVMFKSLLGMQAHHVANDIAACVKPELLVRRLDF